MDQAGRNNPETSTLATVAQKPMLDISSRENQTPETKIISKVSSCAKAKLDAFDAESDKNSGDLEAKYCRKNKFVNPSDPP